ncbi:MAG: GNAT family N-acetyltransferase [Beijerinckiaceae bacterium]
MTVETQMAAQTSFLIRDAVWPDDRASVTGLLRDYAASLDVDLCFQNFEDELAGLPGPYARPDGAMLLAEATGSMIAVGCFRRLDDRRCEMKRLYARPAARGLGVGRALAKQLIRDAQAAGYRAMLLDSLASMIEAQQLYRSLGFVETAPYYDNPLPGTAYMRLDF